MTEQARDVDGQPPAAQAKIQQAMDAARAKTIQSIELPVVRSGLRVTDAIHITAGEWDDAGQPNLLVFDSRRQAFVPVQLKAGRWELRPLGTRLVGPGGQPL